MGREWKYNGIYFPIQTDDRKEIMNPMCNTVQSSKEEDEGKETSRLRLNY